MSNYGGKTRKVLAIDDNRTNLALLKVHLSRMGLEVIMEEDGHKGPEVAVREQPDLILLDIMMPGIDGYEVCRRLKAGKSTSAIPIIFVSTKDSTPDKIMGLELGAIDYITKPFDPGELKARLGIILQMITLQEKLLDQVNTDELTGLSNRRQFSELLDRQVLQAKAEGNELSLIMIDLDHFKQINDTYGHLGGDVILKQLADLLKSNIHALDILGRYGGEEFILIMPNTAGNEAARAAERLRQLTEECHWKISAERIRITISLGLATMTIQEPIDAEELIRRADAALYGAKAQGRNCLVRWEQINSANDSGCSLSEDYVQLQSKISLLTKQLRHQMIQSILELAQKLLSKTTFFSIHHGDRVKRYCLAIAEEMKLPQAFQEKLAVASELHDLGKLSIPQHILEKTDDLTSQERYILQQHPLITVQILKPIGIFQDELQIIKHHHEHYDGTGFPDGLRGKEIPFGARVLAVANQFDNLLSTWARDNSDTYEQVIDEISRQCDTIFDPEIVKAFAQAARKHASQWSRHREKESLPV